jgi:hypothetical protein
MKTITFAAVLAATLTTAAQADTFAVGGVKGDRKGRTVLTTEPCEFKADSFQQGVNKALLGNMRRAFYYTSDGMTNEGCWRHDAGTIVLVWPTENIMRRWPIANFKLAERKADAWEVLQ